MRPETELKLLRMQLSHATEFEIMPQKIDKGRVIGEITIKRRVQRDGSVKWAVFQRGFVLDKDGDWLLEPMPSSRTDDFIADTRFDFADAWKRAQDASIKELSK